MVHVPAAAKETSPLPLIEQMPLETASIVRATGSPEVALAVGVYVPPIVAPTGALLVKAMVWEFLTMPKDCWTWEAAA